MSRKIPVGALSTYQRESTLKWLLRNPLLLVKCRSFSQEYFENQFLLVIKLKLALTYASMIAAMQKRSQIAEVYSTAAVSNYSTLDIHHYLVFQVNPGSQSTFDVTRIPMNMRSAELAELSELNIRLNPNAWRRSTLAAQLADAMKKFERGYMANCIGVDQVTPVIKVYRKIFLAMEYFRRSFRSTSKVEDRIVSLATAFEILLIDSSRSQSKTIADHLTTLMQGVRGASVMVPAVKRLYKLRNQSVHAGQSTGEPNWRRCHLAFIHGFLKLFDKFSRLSTLGQTSTPVHDVINS